jgi:transcription elongation factor Elf1
MPLYENLELNRKKGRLFDYKRACDRCAVEGYLMSQLKKEPQTGKIVCKNCFDLPSVRDNERKYKMPIRNFKFE